jgi:DNA-binding response OmpR family regulator
MDSQTAPAGPSRSILFIEDHEAFRIIVARHLRRRGYEVTDVASTEDALGALDEGLKPSLVLLDVNLPGDTGWALLRSPAMARAGRPPVVIASAVTVRHRRLAAFGVAGYLPKPYPLETLVATVERLLSSTAVPAATPAGTSAA